MLPATLQRDSFFFYLNNICRLNRHRQRSYTAPLIYTAKRAPHYTWYYVTLHADTSRIASHICDTSEHTRIFIYRLHECIAINLRQQMIEGICTVILCSFKYVLVYSKCIISLSMVMGCRCVHICTSWWWCCSSFCCCCRCCCSRCCFCLPVGEKSVKTRP